MNIMQRLWNDEAGFVVSAELVLVATVAVLAMIVGLASARDGINSELADVGDAFNELNQGYIVSHVRGHSSAYHGSQYVDNLDFCDIGADDAGATVDEQCIVHQDACDADEGTAVNATILE